MAATKYPVLRQTLIALSFVGLVGLFFALNHFLVIPRKQQTYNAKVFRVLGEMAADFGERLKGQTDYRINTYGARESSVRVGSCDSTAIKEKFFAALKLTAAQASPNRL